MKKGFILYKDSYDTIKKLNIEQKAELLDAIFDYNILGETKDLSLATDLVFSFMKRQFDTANEKYQNICKRNAKNGLKGGRPVTQDNPDNPVGFLVTQDNPKKPIIDNREKIIDNTYSYMTKWNNKIPQSKIKTLSKTRKAKIATRISGDSDFPTNFELCLDKIAESDFLLGKVTKWKVTFDWLIENDTNYIKILEDNYQNNVQKEKKNYGGW